MRVKHGLVLLCTLTCLAAILSAQDLTLDEIIKKNEDALGGAKAIKNIQTLKLTLAIGMDASVGQLSVPVTIWSKRPELYRMETTMGGAQSVVGHDASGTWRIDPSTGSKEPKKAPENSASGPSIFPSLLISDLIGSLSEFQEEGYKLGLLGKENPAGSPAYRIAVVPKNGVSFRFLLDAATFLPIVRTDIPLVAQVNARELHFSNYRKVGGVVFAHSIDAGSLMHAEIEKIEINIPMDDSLFKIPDTGAQQFKK